MRSSDSSERWTAGDGEDIHRTAVSRRALATADIPGAGMGLTERIIHASAGRDGIGAAEPGSALICRRQVRRAAPLAARRHSLGRQGSANRSSRCGMTRPVRRDAGLGGPSLRGRTVAEVPGDRCCHFGDEADRPPELGLGEWEGRGSDANGSDDPARVVEDWRADGRGVLIEVADTDVGVGRARPVLQRVPLPADEIPSAAQPDRGCAPGSHEAYRTTVPPIGMACSRRRRELLSPSETPCGFRSQRGEQRVITSQDTSALAGSEGRDCRHAESSGDTP